MEKQVATGWQNAQVLKYSNAHRWIIIFDIARIFPLYQSVTGLNWEAFSPNVDHAAVVKTGSHLQAIADNIKNIEDNAAMANHSATFKVEYLDYTKLPDDVKVMYLRKNDGKCIVKDNIKTVQNKLTVDADLPQWLGWYVNEWSGQLFQALSEEGVILKEGLLLIQ